MSKSLVVQFKYLVVELKDGYKILFSPSCSFEFKEFLSPSNSYWCIYDKRHNLIATFHNKIVKNRGIGYDC